MTAIATTFLRARKEKKKKKNACDYFDRQALRAGA